jgi:hydrogenase maturation protease
MKVLVLGMGNPILTDDSVGLAVAERLRTCLAGADVTSSTLIGLGLLDDIAGYDKIFLVDAMSGGSTPGTLKKIMRDEPGGTRHLFTSHGINFFEIMELGALLGYDMPEIGALYGIEIGEETNFGESLSPRIAELLPRITSDIARDILSRVPSLAYAGNDSRDL